MMKRRISSSRLKRRLKKILLYGSIIAIVGLLITVSGLMIWIKHDANKTAARAVAIYHKDKVESLLLEIESFEFTFKERNKAVWALGVLGDERALSKLESLQTHKKCNHAKGLCQYELKKAICKIKGDYRALWQIDNDNYYK